MGSRLFSEIQFKGELHTIQLVNFSVDVNELRPLLPEQIQLRKWNGRGLISMVNVCLKNMKPQAWWLPISFSYQHIGFRVCVDDARLNTDGKPHGIHFLRSFSDSSFLAWAGNRFGHYQLEHASLKSIDCGLELRSGPHYLKYATGAPILDPDSELLRLRELVGSIDRAWAIDDGHWVKTQIVREKWPLQPVESTCFETNFFASAQIEGVFTVPETIFYTWLAPERQAQVSNLQVIPQHIMEYA